MSLKIDFAGPLTTVQDLGRFGYRQDGFGTSGAMDRRAAVTANRLVGNEDDAALLEMTLWGIKATALDRALVCLCGGDFPFLVNGEKKPMNTPVAVSAGDTIQVGAAAKGCRAYLAVHGGFDVPMVSGSRSTNLKCAVGGFQGRRLAVGDILPVLPASPKAAEENTFPVEPYFGPSVTVRAIRGPQAERFSAEAVQTFFSSEYTVTPQSDRMGVRLSGAPIVAEKGVDILSDGIVFGNVQVPKNGQPILLLSDAQTTGGYAKIATVIAADHPTLGQLRPGDRIRFEECTLSKARRLYKEQEKRLPKAIKER